VTRRTFAGLFFALTSGCANAEAGRKPDIKQTGLAVQPTTAQEATEMVDEDDQALRRSYSSSDMKIHSCVRLQEDGSIVGKDCPSGIMVFGPYVSAPSNSNLRLQFEIESPTQISVMSDVLSASATQFHAALEEQVVEAQTRESFRYRIHLFGAARALEARIGLRSAGSADFTISNFLLNVQ
jgi:hypothetical protein